MNSFRKHRIWLSIALVSATLICISAAIVFVFYLPAKVRSELGAPGPELSITRDVYLSFHLFRKLDALDREMSRNEMPRTFIIRSGASASTIANEMEREGLIERAADILMYWEYKGLDRFIREGVYLVEPGYSTVEIAHQFAVGDTGYETFGFLAGWRKEEVDALLLSVDLIDNPLTLQLEDCRPGASDANVGLEGYMFPQSYQIPIGATDKDIYCIFVDQLFSVLPENYAEIVETNGLTLHETITLASIIQREMVSQDEAARIAGVFYNRLKAGMPLQSDPTVQYAVATEKGGPEWWRVDISKNDLEINSPYNTYKIGGLPPGPICNPGPSALAAALSPESHNYFYFRASCDNSGNHTFSESYEEHLAAACQ